MDSNEAIKRKVISLGTKLDIIKRFDNGENKAYISRALGLSQSTVRAILSKASKYREKGKTTFALSSMQCTRNRSPLMIEIEDLLLTWLEECNQKRIPVHGNNIQLKALSLFLP